MSAKHTHTPGPWRVEPRRRSRYPISADHWGELATVWGNEDSALDAEGKANAKLIAAAPALADALERLARLYALVEPRNTVMIQAEAALRLAGRIP